VTGFEKAIGRFFLAARDMVSAHSNYALVGVALVISIWLWFYFKFRVHVPENFAIYYGKPGYWRGEGTYIVLHEYELVSMRIRTFELGIDELQTASRTDTYREGIPKPQKESVVNRVPAKKSPIVIHWRPLGYALSDFVQIQRSNYLENTFRQYVRLGLPLTADGLRDYLRDFKYGIDIVAVHGAAQKKKETVSLSDDVEIPYEG
jgi:hypothetical protein